MKKVKDASHKAGENLIISNLSDEFYQLFFVRLPPGTIFGGLNDPFFHNRCKVRGLGFPTQIELSTIWILSCPNLIIDIGPIQNSMMKLHR